MACARDGAHTRIERAGASFSFFVIKRAPESFFTSSQSARQEIIPPTRAAAFALSDAVSTRWSVRSTRPVTFVAPLICPKWASPNLTALADSYDVGKKLDVSFVVTS
jgi:hypothetical protein